MDTIEWVWPDKAELWIEGPWSSEPDKRQWQDRHTGLACLIVRSPLGSLCGYVGIPPGHPLHGIDFDAVNCLERIHGAHGGLTYSAPCQPTSNQAYGVCHVPGPGEPDDLWWLGFDCGHFTDRVPSVERILPPDMVLFGSYRTLDYVTGCCQRLAASLADYVDS